MTKIETKTSKLGENRLAYSFPESERIIIDKANLQIQLGKFRYAISNRFNLESIVVFIVTLLGLWIPIVTADFKKVGEISGFTIRNIYIGFSTFVTLFTLYKKIYIPIIAMINRKQDYHHDPEKMTKIILDKCSKQ